MYNELEDTKRTVAASIIIARDLDIALLEVIVGLRFMANGLNRFIIMGGGWYRNDEEADGEKKTIKCGCRVHQVQWFNGYWNLAIVVDRNDECRYRLK